MGNLTEKGTEKFTISFLTLTNRPNIVGFANSFKEFVTKNKHRLNYANLIGKDLSGCDLSDAYLSYAHLENCNLSNVNFEGARLYKTRFSQANLDRANINDITLLRFSRSYWKKNWIKINDKEADLKYWEYFFSEKCNKLEFGLERDSILFQEMKKQFLHFVEYEKKNNKLF